MSAAVLLVRNDFLQALGARARVYRSFIRNAFLTMLAYRLRYVTGILTYVIFVAVYYFIWQAVFSGQPKGAVINGFTLPEMLTYISVGWVSRSFYFTDIDYEIDDIVKSGQISTYLLRPVNFQLMMLAQAVGQSLFRIAFFALPIALTIFTLFPILPPAGLRNFSYFFVSTAAGFLVLAELNFIVGLLAFFLKSI